MIVGHEAVQTISNLAGFDARFERYTVMRLKAVARKDGVSYLKSLIEFDRLGLSDDVDDPSKQRATIGNEDGKRLLEEVQTGNWIPLRDFFQDQALKAFSLADESTSAGLRRLLFRNAVQNHNLAGSLRA